MRAQLYVGNKLVRINERKTNGFVRTVQEAFRMESCVSADVKVEVVG